MRSLTDYCISAKHFPATTEEEEEGNDSIVPPLLPNSEQGGPQDPHNQINEERGDDSPERHGHP